MDTKIIFLEGLTTLTDLLEQHLDAYGFTFEPVSTVDDMVRILRDQTVDGLLLDLDTSDGEPSQLRLEQLHKHQAFTLPMVAMSRCWSTSLRLQAIKAGCDALFTKPLDYPELARALESLTHPKVPEPYRVLVVEDSRTQALYMRQLLEGGGMVVELVNDPLAVVDALPLFQPDLILMDLYMPGCDGHELAALLRMERAYLDVPIIFLSSETDRDKQLNAMRKGADDFLTKGMDEEHLLSSVRIRAARTRMLRDLLRQDSLTGLFNHSSLLSRLGEEVIRATRMGSSLAYAMVDIDHFKTVNDTHGHATGDRVLQALSLLLQRRLRRTDVVGRYGGEEFGIILPDTTEMDAIRVLNELREAFSLLSFLVGNTSLKVTVSAGVARFEPGMTAETFCDAADSLLYVAKHAGRNCVKPQPIGAT